MGGDESLQELWSLCCCCLVNKSCLTLWPHGLQPTRLLCPWDSPGKNTRVFHVFLYSCHALLQGIFPTQGSNLRLLHCRWILYRWAVREIHYRGYRLIMVGLMIFFLFDLMMMWKWYAFSRNRTSYFEFWPLLSCANRQKPQLPFSHEITRISTRYTFSQSAPR